MSILTERTLLRRPTVDDLGVLHALDNDAEVMRWINGGLEVSLEEFESTIMPVYLNHEAYSQAASVLGFWLAETEVVIGWVCLRATGQPGQVSLGYRLVKDAWGQGFATEIAAGIVSACRATGEATEIIASTYEKNVGSQGVLKKLGFTESRRFQPTDPSDTSVSDGEVWEGDDIEYVLRLG